MTRHDRGRAAARNDPELDPDREHGDGGAPAVLLHGVGKTYGGGRAGVRALRDVDLEVRRGEFVVLLGPSGSGKTTLLNLIGGIEPATSGTVVAGGRDLSGLDEDARTAYRRDTVGFVFQFFNLVPSLTALENVRLVAELTGRGDRERAAAALESVGLAGRGGHFPAQLSGGEQQRVAIARAIAKDPELLLCDEPTGALDLETGRGVLRVLQDLNRRGRTVMVVTHNAAIAAIAHRVVRMRDGRVAEVTTTAAPAAAGEVAW
ncbi:ABC transporter ATP-binding protein [Actinomadura livida]|uniref:ABC transporter ATP-binding protein n=1 Tax=Actinomadura livida TaxID=79909 RepID=A0A7W7IE47_9ACTN|nr:MULTISPECIES: ABC transporter ATP-binding protein [Actinomadura]MBB4775434.1 putative ABC transport system ATP-binding protein [Actinomadura catellatispora]GGT90284.1 ABC transporter [Actinomadura livida]